MSLNLFLLNLKKTLETKNPDEKWLIAPTLRIGNSWLDLLARNGSNILGVRIKTLKGMGFLLAEKEMAAQNVESIGSIKSEIFFCNLLDEMAANKSCKYLGSLMPGLGLARALGRTVFDLRMSGIEPENLNEKDFFDNTKGYEILYAFKKYRDMLEENNLIDYARALKFAASNLNNNPVLKNVGSIIIPKDIYDSLFGLEKDLLGLFKKQKNSILQIIKVSRPENGADRTDAGSLSNVTSFHKASRPKNDNTVQIIRTAGENFEIFEIIGQISQSAIPLDQVEIMYTNHDVYVPLLYEIFKGLEFETDEEFPATFSRGIPVKYTRPGRALLGWLSWEQDGFQNKTIENMQKEGLVHQKFEWKHSNAKKGHSSNSAPAHLSDNYLQLEQLINLKYFLKNAVIISGKLDEFALLAITKAINEMIESIGKKTPGFFKADDYIRDLYSSTSIKGEGPKPGCVFVTPWNHGGHSGRKHVYFLGLSRDYLAENDFSTPLVLEEEQKKMNISLQGRNPAGTAEKTSLMFARQRACVTLCYKSFNVINNEKNLPSDILLSAMRIITGNFKSTIDELIHDSSIEVTGFPTQKSSSLFEFQSWNKYFLSSNSPLENKILFSRYPHLTDGDKAQKARMSSLLTEYDGFVPGAALKFGDAGAIFSTSAFSTLAKCPMEYFFKYILGIRPVDDDDEEQVWPDTAKKGTLLHSIFSDFINYISSGNLKVEVKRDTKILHGIVNRRFDEFLKTNPAPSEIERDDLKKEIIDTVDIFLSSEENNMSNLLPKFTETAIGLTVRENSSAIDSPEPQIIELEDKKISVKGRMDRIDENITSEQKEYAIWDYKTGGASWYENKENYLKGQLIQNALYVEMLKARLKDLGDEAKVTKAGYIFSSPTELFRRKICSEKEMNYSKTAIVKLVKILESGCFNMSPCYDDYKYSDYKDAIFGSNELLSAVQTKLESIDKNPELGYFKFLRNKQK